ncbi:RloB family protein [Streptomyces sp. NPDC000987]|uniref:RloB family protein n=1 Tax=Streptomyces sp. NPDC000987 TaxID=3154374 RepID=UPI00332E511A
MTRGQPDPQNRNQPRGRRRRRDADQPLRRPPQSYGDESRRVVYIAAEGDKTERDYVALLNRAYGEREKFCLKFHGAKNGLRPTEVVNLLIQVASDPADEKWALFDRDARDNRDQDIPEAMRKAAEQGVQVSLSHPSFELWLLLHFQQFTSQEGGVSDTVLRRLREHRDAKGFEEYDKASGDRGKGLDDRRGQSLLDREKDAVRNARKLVSLCSHGTCSARNLVHAPIPGPRTESYEVWTRRTGHAGNCDPLKRDPSSDVWRLLVHLGVVRDETPAG